MRVTEPPIGWRLVKECDADGGTVFAPTDGKSSHTRPLQQTSGGRDWQAEAERCAKALTPEKLQELASSLGVTADSLRALGVGWRDDDQSFTFPEVDAAGQVIGINRRFGDGTKKAMYQGHRGLSVPREFSRRSNDVLIVEGASDVAACLTLGLTAVGRPSDRSSKHLADMLAGRAVIVLGERDPKPDGKWPGRDGAKVVAKSLAKTWHKSVRWSLPPDDAKDVRAWLASQNLDLDDKDALAAAGQGFLQSLQADACTIATRTAETDSADNPNDRPHLITRCMADVEPCEIQWLWPNRIPAGRLSVIAGAGEAGKSWLTLAVASILSRGDAWPDDPTSKPEPGATVLLASEDNPEDTIRTRLDNANADCNLIHVVEGVRRTELGESMQVSLKHDLRALEGTIVSTGAKLCVIDPITQYMDGTDSHKDSQVRGILGPIAGLACRTECAVLCIMHLNKGVSSNASHRVSGSLGFTNAARMCWLVSKDPDDESRRLFLPYKCNIIERPNGLAFRLIDGRLVWDNEAVTIEADTVLAKTEESCGKSGEAQQWLIELLALGPVKVKDIRAAGESDGHSWRTLLRAKKAIGARSVRDGFGAAGAFSWDIHRAELSVCAGP